MEEGFRSYAAQTLHYFDRPDEKILRARLDSPAAWRGAEIAADPGWRYRLSEADREELDAALACASSTGRSRGDLRPEDFPLPGLGPRIALWRRELSVHGRGFLLLSGAPVDRWSEEEASTFFWGLGLHLGTPGAQNPAGDLLGHVIDTGEDVADPQVRLYRTSSNIRYHCDAADVVGLLCLRAARVGGLSRIASSVTVWNEIVTRRPDLAPRLFSTFAVDLRNENRPGMAGWVPLAPCRFGGGALRTFFHSDYFRSAARHLDAPPLDAQDSALLDLYEEIADDPGVRLEMELAPGDIQLLSNHTIVHARTDYEDAPDRRRHLLRLWLSLDGEGVPESL